jgi:hypothetical protein
MQGLIEAEVCLPLSTPVINRRPRLWRTRSLNLILKKFGEPVDEIAPDKEVEANFLRAFHGDMTSRKQRCL